MIRGVGLDFDADPNGPENADSGDEFVIPSLADWVQSYPLLDHTKALHKPKSGKEEISDVDRMCQILKTHRRSLEDVVRALNGCGASPSKSLLEQVLRRFSNDWVPAFGTFSWAKSQTGYVHSPEVCDLMVDILGKSKKFHLMWELAEEMSGMEGYVSFVTMSKIIRRLAKAKKFEDAIEAFKGMNRFGVSKDIKSLNVLMDAMVKGDSVESAEEAFSAFKDEVGLSSESFNILIHGFCKCRKLDDARRVMEEMEKHGLRPDSVSYTCFVDAHCREKDFRSAESILKEMTQKGCPPNVVTYTIYMHALGKAKQINEALGVYEKMKSRGCVPDTSFYNSLIYILSKAGRSKDAQEIFEDMEAEGVDRDVLTYNTMIAAACERSQELVALKLLKKMEEESCQPDLKTYAPLLKMCTRKKRMRVLHFLLSHMLRNNVSIDLGTYELLVRGLCKSGKLDKACSFLEEMVSKGWTPRETICKLLIEKLDAAGMVKEKEHAEKLMSTVK
ncbi:pentatricopeptide repeat-containing protein At3g22670, mitochondrial-like [Punica granatum]|uniref:Pentatricopeptide repeat-containing protein At3g22670, mitochondrial-like n=1 Tax=Punica granatum TaxID=22663 RepID=A0A6P8BY27_PUNGR|nr:pentatricopeptide repeat-containing protein At3g22670, mitochondrial-like [Punica granatum]